MKYFLLAVLLLASSSVFAGQSSPEGVKPNSLVMKRFLQLANIKGSAIYNSLQSNDALKNEVIVASSVVTVLTEETTENRSSFASSNYEVFVGWMGSGYLGSTSGVEKFYCNLSVGASSMDETVSCDVKPIPLQYR